MTDPIAATRDAGPAADGGEGPVLTQIDAILNWARDEANRMGYFAALYRHVAMALAEGRRRGVFARPDLIEQVNEGFFGRYLEAVDQHRAGRPTTAAWRVAFDAAASDRPIVIQHLLVGANAHINLDLAIAVARTLPPDELATFRPDYERMNDLLASLFDDISGDLGRILPLLRMVTTLFRREEDSILGFSMRSARAAAWTRAIALAAMSDADREAEIARIDAEVAGIGRFVADPGPILGLGLRIARRFEEHDVRVVINDLLDRAPDRVTAAVAAAPRVDPAPAPVAGPAPAAGPTPAAGPPARRRVAILGGGQSALTAALQLTDPRNPRHAELDVTIHQLGWRLGGKGATGRPTDRPWARQRVEEHGLHNWFGFYDNALREMRDVYRELGRPAGSPMATFEDAFEPADEAVFIETIGGAPRPWAIHNLSNSAKPGEGGLLLTPWQYAGEAIQLIARLIGGTSLAGRSTTGVIAGTTQDRLEELAGAAAHDLREASVETLGGLLQLAHQLATALETHTANPADHPLLSLVARLHQEVDRDLAAIERAVETDVERTVETVATDVLGRRAPAWIRELEHVGFVALSWVLWLFMAAFWDLVKDGIETDAKETERRIWIPANLGFASITGAMVDGVVTGGFDVINDRDFRAWIAGHAYDDGGVTMQSPLIEAIYTALFAYPDGDATVPPGGRYAPAERTEAGTSLKGMIRAAFTYRGAFAYRFRAGTADTCYAPAYEVLRRRGVTFSFFDRVDHLELEDGRIARIVIGRQARLTPDREPERRYDPLVEPAGLPVWPDQPRWEQLADADWFRANHADFENPSADMRQREEPVVLHVGTDFDEVILGIPVASHPHVAAALIDASDRWRTAVREIATVRTQALQVWLTKTEAELGFDVPRRPIVTWLYDRLSPLNVWGEYGELLDTEGWPADGRPASLAYFCSTMPDDGADPFDPFPDVEAATAQVRRNAEELLERGLGLLLPGAIRDGAFDWDLLHDPRPEPGVGAARLDAQFWKANITPSERYVLSNPGTSVHRLPVHDPDLFPNLYLAGDWTQCGLNSGCMEAATMSGMLCSNALSGYPLRADIVGVDF